MREITVLLTACAAQFAPGIVNCLKENGERNVRLIGVDMHEDKTLCALYDALYPVPAAADPRYAETLLSICKTERVDVLMPFMSAELLPLIDRQDDFEAAGTRLSVSDRRSVEICANKLRFYEFMQASGLKVPKFRAVRTADELLPACEAAGYPEKAVCVKATELSGSRGIRILDPAKSRYDLLFGEKPNSMYTTMEELQAALRERPQMPEMMAMECLPGEEGSVDLLADHGKILYMAYRESNVNLASIPQEATLADNPEAYAIARGVIAALGFDGSADLDFRCDAEGRPVLMEVNPRIAATMRIFKEGGMNLPYLRVKQLLGESLPPASICYGLKMKRRYLEMFA